jgi:hypothetical protein
MFKVKVSDEFFIKVINSQRIKIKTCCFICCFWCIMILLTNFQSNWNQWEKLIERTVLKSFHVGYIHVKVKVNFRCIKFMIKLHWFWLPIFIQSLCLYSIMDKEDILGILLLSINSKYKVSWCCHFLTNVDDVNIVTWWINSNSVDGVLELI